MIQLKTQLEALLVQRGLNASQLSRIAGVPRQNIANWMMGQKPKDLNQVKKVADSLSVSIDHLLYGEAEATKFSFDKIVDGRFEIKIKKID